MRFLLSTVSFTKRKKEFTSSASEVHSKCPHQTKILSYTQADRSYPTQHRRRRLGYHRRYPIPWSKKTPIHFRNRCRFPNRFRRVRRASHRRPHPDRYRRHYRRQSDLRGDLLQILRRHHRHRHRSLLQLLPPNEKTLTSRSNLRSEQRARTCSS